MKHGKSKEREFVNCVFLFIDYYIELMVTNIDSFYEAKLQYRRLLFHQSDQQELESKLDMICVQGFIDGHAGQEFTVAEIVKETNISGSVVYKLLPNCKRYKRLRKGQYKSLAKAPLPTEAGLLEEQSMKMIGLIGEQARQDHFDLRTRGKRKK